MLNLQERIGFKVIRSRQQ